MVYCLFLWIMCNLIFVLYLFVMLVWLNEKKIIKNKAYWQVCICRFFFLFPNKIRIRPQIIFTIDQMLLTCEGYLKSTRYNSIYTNRYNLTHKVHIYAHEWIGLHWKLWNSHFQELNTLSGVKVINLIQSNLPFIFAHKIYLYYLKKKLLRIF